MKKTNNDIGDMFSIGLSTEDHKTPLKVKTKIDPKLSISNLSDVLKMPHIVQVRGEFTEDSCSEFISSFHAAEQTGQPIIPIVIDSYGGDAYALLAMIDVVKNSRAKVATIIIGKAMSAGAFLASCGTEGLRFASPNATIMIHSVSGGAIGNVDEVKINVNEQIRINKKVMEIMSLNCGQSKGYFDALMEKKKNDWYLTPQDARKHNLVNEIRIPEFMVEISARIEFK